MEKSLKPVMEGLFALGMLAACTTAMAANPNPLVDGNAPTTSNSKSVTQGAPAPYKQAQEPLGYAPAYTGTSASAATTGSPGAVEPSARKLNPNPIGQGAYQPPPLPAHVKVDLHRLIEALMTGNQRLWIEHATPPFRQATGSPSRFAAMAHTLTSRYDLKSGWHADFLTILNNPPMKTYVWRLRLNDGRQLLATLTLQQGHVAGFYLL